MYYHLLHLDLTFIMFTSVPFHLNVHLIIIISSPFTQTNCTALHYFLKAIFMCSIKNIYRYIYQLIYDCFIVYHIKVTSGQSKHYKDQIKPSGYLIVRYGRSKTHWIRPKGEKRLLRMSSTSNVADVRIGPSKLFMQPDTDLRNLM